MISLLVIPFLVCCVLVLIHAYFGTRILEKGILFIDLALAQWAALGFLVAHLVHIEGWGAYAIAFGFTVIASVIMAFFKSVYGQVNLQEAVIGVMYISGTALAVGLISLTGMEGYHLKSMLTGHLLFVSWKELFFASALYLLVSGVLRLLQSHRGPLAIRELIFYLLFGAVVTSSVHLVGLLLVFSYLVLPVLTFVHYQVNRQQKLIFAWVFGTLASVLGLILSVYVDVPPSYCIILTLCMGWIALTKYSLGKPTA